MKQITIEDNEAYLRQISKPVNFPDPDLKKEIDVLSQFCKENEVLAMAAVQLGIPKRLVYLKNTNLELINKMQDDIITEEEHQTDEERVLINPVVRKREGLTDYWEACASCKDYIGHVFRPFKMEVEYMDIHGNQKTKIFEGFEATVLSHELDHLDGILHMDVADQVYNMTKEERKEFRKTHGYNITSKSGNYEEWLKQKSKNHTLIKK